MQTLSHDPTCPLGSPTREGTMTSKTFRSANCSRGAAVKTSAQRTRLPGIPKWYAAKDVLRSSCGLSYQRVVGPDPSFLGVRDRGRSVAPSKLRTGCSQPCGYEQPGALWSLSVATATYTLSRTVGPWSRLRCAGGSLPLEAALRSTPQRASSRGVGQTERPTSGPLVADGAR